MPKRKNTDSSQRDAKRLAGALERMTPVQKAIAALRNTQHTPDDGGWLTGIIGSVEAMYRAYTKETTTANMLTCYGCALFVKAKFDKPTHANMFACFFLASKMLDDESPDHSPEYIVLPNHARRVPSIEDLAAAEYEIVQRLDWNAHLSRDQMSELLIH